MRPFATITSPVARVSLVVAVAAALANIGSYFGLTMRGRLEMLSVLHLITMATGIVVFARLWVHHRLFWRSPRAEITRVRLPRWLFWSSAIALLYVLVMFAWAGRHGEGSPEIRDGKEVWVRPDSSLKDLPPGSVAAYARDELRLFSAGWLMFSLMIAATSHVIEHRISKLREWQQSAAA